MKLTSNKILSHYGIPNQKWGKRNYQYEDGTYTPEGKERYFGSKIVNKFRQIKEKILPTPPYKRINQRITKEIENVMLNKHKFKESEYINKLNSLQFEKDIYNNNVKPNKKYSWTEDIRNKFLTSSAENIGKKLGSDMAKFLVGGGGGNNNNNKKKNNKKKRK